MPRVDRRSWRVRAGSLLLILGVVWFYALQVLTAAAWPSPGYNWRRDAVSDLGNTVCGPFTFHGPTVWVCSPWHELANAGFVVVGSALAAGFWLLQPFWPRHGVLPRIGTALMVLAGIGSGAVGLAPENVHPWLHVAAAQSVPLLGIATALLAIVALHAPAARSGRSGAVIVLGRAGVVTALVAFVGGLWSAVAEVFGAPTAWPLGVGGLERLTIYPSTLWILAVALSGLARPALMGPAGDDPEASAPRSAAPSSTRSQRWHLPRSRTLHR